MTKQLKTSWEKSSQWYDSVVGEKGHYYHKTVILPKLLNLMDLKPGDKLLDLGCGQGVLSRVIPNEVEYVGIDLSKSLIAEASNRIKQPHHRFLTGDVTKKPILKDQDFSHIAMVLCLQNMEYPLAALKTAAFHIQKRGKLFLVLNHPCFRIPRQTHWGFDEEKKLQYRQIDSYLSNQKIPIQTHPGKSNSETTWSFHFPLSSYFTFFQKAGFIVSGIEEWVSDKKSSGGRARMENRARKEIPLFMQITLEPSFSFPNHKEI